MALISKASLLMVPSTYEEGTLYNVLPSGNRAPDSTDQNSGYDQTRADFTFDRGSNAAATRIGSDGLIKKYRENKLLHSNDFSQSEWSKLTNSTYTLTTETIVDPFGISKAVYKVTLTGNGYITLRQSFMGDTSYMTASVYVKLGSSDYNVTLDQSDGDSQTATANTEWQRLSSTHASGYSFSFIDIALTGDSGDYFYVSSAQMQLGGVSTDYLDSGATTAKAGVLIDLPRINYDANGENGALLLEPSRQQLFQYSEYLSTFGGTATINDNVAISPEGLQNAAEVVLSSSGTDSFYKEVAVTANTKYTLSFYVKQGSNTNNQLAVRDQTNSTFIATDVSYTASPTEWKRVEYTFTTPAGCVEARIYPHRSSSSSEGNGYFYGVQCEAGSYATSYIPNHGESGGVTRAADSCSVTGVSDVIGQTEGTLFAEVKNIPNNETAFIAPTISDGSLNNSIYILRYTSGGINYIEIAVRSGGVLGVDQRVALDVNDGDKIAFAYKQNDFVVYRNGSQILSDISGNVPSTSNVYLGMNYNGSATTRGDFSQATLFNERLSNAELAALTA